MIHYEKKQLLSQEKIDELLSNKTTKNINAVVEANIPLAIKISLILRLKYGMADDEIILNDMIACGIIGLISAAKKFDPKRKCKFSTFAYYSVHSKINDFIKKEADIKYATSFTINEIPNEENVCFQSKEDSFASTDIEHLLSYLTEKEAFVIREYFISNKLFREIGASLGISKQYTNKIFIKAIEKLKRKVSCVR